MNTRMLWRSLHAAWRFSQFYGAYHTMPMNKQQDWMKDSAHS